MLLADMSFFFFFQAEDGIRDVAVTGVQTCALPISDRPGLWRVAGTRVGWGDGVDLEPRTEARRGIDRHLDHLLRGGRCRVGCLYPEGAANRARIAGRLRGSVQVAHRGPDHGGAHDGEERVAPGADARRIEGVGCSRVA